MSSRPRADAGSCATSTISSRSQTTRRQARRKGPRNAAREPRASLSCSYTTATRGCTRSRPRPDPSAAHRRRGPRHHPPLRRSACLDSRGPGRGAAGPRRQSTHRAASAPGCALGAAVEPRHRDLSGEGERRDERDPVAAPETVPGPTSSPITVSGSRPICWQVARPARRRRCDPSAGRARPARGPRRAARTDVPARASCAGLRAPVSPFAAGSSRVVDRAARGRPGARRSTAARRLGRA